MKITDEMWHCPECGAGYEGGTGLIGPDYTTYEEYKDAYGADATEPPESYGECYCEACHWSGHITEVVEAHQRKQGRKPCPHCGGTGWAEGGR